VDSSSIKGLSTIYRILLRRYVRGYSIPRCSEALEFVYYQILYYPTKALNYMNCRIVKNTLKIQNLLRRVSVHAGTIIREPKSVPS